MKKDNLAALAIITLLSTCTMGLFATKIESIILSVEMPSYFIFASMLVISSLLLLSKNDISDVVKLLSNKGHKKSEIPSKIYNFCKIYYSNSEDVVTEYIQNEIKSKRLANFLIRYVDKNTKEEIDDYISTQEVIESKTYSNARKAIYYSNIFIVISVMASYVYDSNIKGILFIAGLLSLSNLFIYNKIENNALNAKEELVLYRKIYDDILNYKNSKSIMYKCNSILGISEDFTDIDDSTTYSAEEDSENKTTQNTKNIEQRKSSPVIVGNDNKIKEKHKKSKKAIKI